jgi:hypothetical protein
LVLAWQKQSANRRYKSNEDRYLEQKMRAVDPQKNDNSGGAALFFLPACGKVKQINEKALKGDAD